MTITLTGKNAVIFAFCLALVCIIIASVIRSGTGCENINSQKLHKKAGFYQYRMEYEKLLND